MGLDLTSLEVFMSSNDVYFFKIGIIHTYVSVYDQGKCTCGVMEELGKFNASLTRSLPRSCWWLVVVGEIGFLPPPQYFNMVLRHI